VLSHRGLSGPSPLDIHQYSRHTSPRFSGETVQLSISRSLTSRLQVGRGYLPSLRFSDADSVPYIYSSHKKQPKFSSAPEVLRHRCVVLAINAHPRIHVPGLRKALLTLAPCLRTLARELLRILPLRANLTHRLESPDSLHNSLRIVRYHANRALKTVSNRVFRIFCLHYLSKI
jgi:hypothetical protein